MITIIKTINRILNKSGYKIVRIKNKSDANLSSDSKATGYISALETIKKAKESGLSIGDYVEKEWDQVGDTQKVIDNMSKFNVFQKAKHICEIGPGTGRYLKKVIDICMPELYEFYETANDWADYLKHEYPVISRQASGRDLNETADNSVDLLHANGVFVYLPFIVSYSYFCEASRIVKIGGFVVFDIYSEDCTDKATANKWLKSNHVYPCFLSTEYVDNFFLSNNFEKLGYFFNKYGEGRSKYLIYKKSS